MVLFHYMLGLYQTSLEMLLRTNNFGLFMLDPPIQSLPFLIINFLVDPTTFQFILQHLQLLTSLDLKRLTPAVQC